MWEGLAAIYDAVRGRPAGNADRGAAPERTVPRRSASGRRHSGSGAPCYRRHAEASLQPTVQ